MLIRNIKLTVSDISEKTVQLRSELGQTISVARDFLETVKVGDAIYLSADSQPIKLTEELAKDVLNNLLNEDSTE